MAKAQHFQLKFESIYESVLCKTINFYLVYLQNALKHPSRLGSSPRNGCGFKPPGS